jgi:hypothetical protein
MNTCFTAGKRFMVWNCHATCRHRKTTIFTSIVYGIKTLFSLLERALWFETVMLSTHP